MERALFPPGLFLEVFADAPSRWSKRAIRRACTAARWGEIRNFTGLDSPYEPPEAAELRLRTTEQAV